MSNVIPLQRPLDGPGEPVIRFSHSVVHLQSAEGGGSWRRVKFWEGLTWSAVHDIVQAAFGWDGRPAYRFSGTHLLPICGPVGPPAADGLAVAHEVDRADAFLRSGDTLLYEWWPSDDEVRTVVMTLEGQRLLPTLVEAVCLAGAGPGADGGAFDVDATDAAVSAAPGWPPLWVRRLHPVLQGPFAEGSDEWHAPACGLVDRLREVPAPTDEQVRAGVAALSSRTWTPTDDADLLPQVVDRLFRGRSREVLEATAAVLLATAAGDGHRSQVVDQLRAWWSWDAGWPGRPAQPWKATARTVSWLDALPDDETRRRLAAAVLTTPGAATSADPGAAAPPGPGSPVAGRSRRSGR